MTDAIDRRSTEPFYLQLASIIKDEIGRGVHAEGERLPPEMELCRRYDLARSTVREALRHLTQEGLIRMVPRRGAFVSAASDSLWNLQVTQGFLEAEAHSPDSEIKTRVLRSGYEQLPSFAANALKIGPGDTGFVLERVRFLKGEPAMHSTNWLPPGIGALLTGMPVLEGRDSLNKTLRMAGVRIGRARREVAAVAASAETSKLLGLSKGAPILRISSTSQTESGAPFDYYISYVRSDVVSISVDAVAHF